jgi:hypothetical protein
MRDHVDWAALLRAALAMGLHPEGFWKLSVREWRMLAQAPDVLERTELERLMANDPDELT